MKRKESSDRGALGTDAVFLGSFLSTTGFTIAGFFDPLFIVLTLASFLVWLSLTLIVLRRMGVSAKTALLQRRLVSGLPSNKKLHGFYIVALLVSLNLFFALMIIEFGLYSLLAFMIWLFIGSQATQELSGESGSKKDDIASLG